MVATRQPDLHPSGRNILDVRFRQDPTEPNGFDLANFSDLRRRSPVDTWFRPFRTEFHTICLITHGTGRHAIDFQSFDCQRGDLLWMRPGQTQQLDFASTLDGPVVLFTPDFLPPSRDPADWGEVPYGPARWTLGSHDHLLISGLFDVLSAEHRRDVGSSTRVLALLVTALVLTVARAPHRGQGPLPAQSGGASGVYSAFRDAVERRYRSTRRISDLAIDSGFSTRTIDRASVATTGRTAKEVVDARVILEAQRLLAHTDMTVATIGAELGFSEATNFGKFFSRRQGMTPGQFRSRIRADGLPI